MIIKRPTITTRGVRSKLREPNNRNDDLFINYCISKGVLDPRYKMAAPTGVNRIIGKEPTAKFGTKTYGSSTFKKLKYKEFLGQELLQQVVVENKYNPANMADITSGTKLNKGIRIGPFVANLESQMGQSTLNDIKSLEERKKIARHYYMQSLLMTGFVNNEDRFGKYNLVITEGLYLPETTETLTPDDIKDLATKGRAVVYEVIDSAGQMAPEMTFDVAHYWKDNFLFDNLILSYDTVDPNKPFNAQIVVTMPEVDLYYKGSFSRKVSTEFNFKMLIDDGLAEAYVASV